MFTLAPAPRDGLPSPDTVEVPDTSVTACIVTAGGLHHRLHSGLLQTLLTDIEYGWGNFKGEKIHTSGANISKERNTILRRFLDTDNVWAWLIDSDMVIDGDTLPRLLCSAAVTGAKVIGGLCCMVGDDGPIPTVYQLGNPDAGEVTRVMLDYPDDTIVQVAATGAACILVHRDVIEGMRDARPDLTFPWFYEEEVAGNWVSEDIGFCLRANQLGYPVFVDCTTHIGHAKGRDIWWPKDIRAERGFPQPKTYAVIPSKTSELIDDTVRQLHAQGVDHEHIVVLDNTAGGFKQLGGCSVLHMPGAGIHEMWNAGIDWCLQDANQRRNVNILVLNDDLYLGPGFVPEMVKALRSDRNMVAVSGNYDGRPGYGVQEVHDICAGRYDGTGGLAGFAFAITGEWCQSGYRFPEECKWWYGDNDLILAVRASEVGKVGIALGAHVEHLDGGGKTGGDWTEYRDQLERDRVAFEARWQALTPPAVSGSQTVTVVSSIFGGYDQPCPLVLQQGVRDYLMVTDATTFPPSPWTLRTRHVSATSERDPDPRYLGKHAKYQPWEYTDADIVVWLDGRVQTVSPHFVAWLIDNLGDADIALYRHPMRTSILAEAEAALVENPAKYAGHDLVGQAKHYLTDDYDDVNLWQTTFYVARRNERTLTLGRRWQEEQDRFPDCLLDQIPFAPLVAECGVKVADLPGGFWSQHGRLYLLQPHIDGT